MVRSFQDLVVWQKAHNLVLKVYQITRNYPPEEKFGLISQMRRAAISVAANIAEGFRKRGRKDKINFYNIARSSLDELHYYILLSKDLVYVSDATDVMKQVEEISKMLSGLIRSIGARECFIP